MKQKSAIVFPSRGLGDGLLMMIASFYLHKQGFHVSVYHNHLYELKSLFPYATIYKKLETFHEITKQYENPYTVLQHSNRSEDNLFIKQCRSPLTVLYGEHREGKHLPLTPLDRILSSKETMATSIDKAMMSLLEAPSLNKSNGIALQSSQKKARHVLIHPTSTDIKRNYPAEKFIWLAEKLIKQGFEVTFCMHPLETKEWIERLPKGAKLPLLPSLADTAKCISSGALLIGNDSGLAHLASNLGLPSLVFSKSKPHIRRWKPDFVPSIALTPPSWVPNFKPLRLRQTYWHHFITPRHVLHTALNLMGPV